MSLLHPSDLVSAALVAGAFGRWGWMLAAGNDLPRGRSVRWPLLVFPLLGVIVLVAVLKTAADPEVRASGSAYFPWFVGLGLVWMFGSAACFKAVHLDYHADVVENRNPAAVWAIALALLGAELTYVGGNIGQGEEVSTTFFAAGLALGVWFALWVLVELLARPSEAIVVDRDLASGIRLGGLLVAQGFVLGRAVAGDWVSFDGTLRDFAAFGWPAGLAAVAASAMERFFRPHPAEPTRSVARCGVAPALVWVVLAGWWAFHLGHW